MFLLALLACPGNNDDGFTTDTSDTGNTLCGRVRGTPGVMLFYPDDQVGIPKDGPDTTTASHGVAGPLSDGLTWVAAYGPKIQQSVDSGCNWDDVGNLPSTGDWSLIAAGDRVYAFDRNSGDGARSDDAGVSWTPFDSTLPFVGEVTPDPADPTHLRGIQTRGVVTTSDGGDSWQVTGGVPGGSLLDASVSATDLDTILVGMEDAAWLTRGGGTTWDDVSAAMPHSKKTPGIRVPQVAVHPENPSVLFALSQNGDGRYSVAQSADHGGAWEEYASSQGSNFDDRSGLWPVPGRTDAVVSAWGSAEDSYGLNVYTITEGSGTHKLHIGIYYRLTSMVIAADRWVTSVDAVVD